MQVYTSAAAAEGLLRGGSVAIGNFDGVHRGHRELLARAVADARRRGVPAVAFTFSPHPARILAPGLAPRLISTPARKRELLAACGLDAVIEQPFDLAFAAQPPEAFTALLLDQVGLRHVVVGYDFSFGKARAGRVELLRAECARRGATVEVVTAVEVDGLVASSTKVREFVLAGNVAAAARLLARPFDVEGPVVRGDGRGRTIGVPTANVQPAGELLPALGVYAVRVRLPSGTWVRGACNVGLNPTFKPDSAGGPTNLAVTVEVHLLEGGGDLYGQVLRVAFVERVREERRFPNAAALVARIREDVAHVATLLTDPHAAPTDA